jgi:hypothetical protein
MGGAEWAAASNLGCSGVLEKKHLLQARQRCSPQPRAAKQRRTGGPGQRHGCRARERELPCCRRETPALNQGPHSSYLATPAPALPRTAAACTHVVHPPRLPLPPPVGDMSCHHLLTTVIQKQASRRGAGQPAAPFASSARSLERPSDRSPISPRSPRSPSPAAAAAALSASLCSSSPAPPSSSSEPSSASCCRCRCCCRCAAAGAAPEPPRLAGCGLVASGLKARPLAALEFDPGGLGAAAAAGGPAAGCDAGCSAAGAAAGVLEAPASSPAGASLQGNPPTQ